MTKPHFQVFDVESTGVDTDTDRIVQLVIATADIDGNLLAHREWIIDPGVEVPEGAAAVHGLTTEYLQAHGQDPFTALEEARDFFASYGDLILVAYNLNYDASIITNELYRHNVDYTFGKWITQRRLFDPLVVDRGLDKYRKGPRKLFNVAAHYNVPVDETKLHNALYDVELTAKVASAVAKHHGIPTTGAQARLQEAWRSNFEQYLRRTDPDAIVEAGWPLKNKKEEA